MSIARVHDLRLANPCWDDLIVPAATIYTPGASGTGPTHNTSDGTLEFDWLTTENIFVHIQFPHRWLIGSTISPHLHWMKSTSASGGVSWKMRYKWANIGATFGAFSAWDEATVYVSDDDTADHQALAEFSEISGTGKTLSSMMIVELQRDHDDTGDTYAALAKLLEFDIHIQIDSFGSDHEYEKGD